MAFKFIHTADIHLDSPLRGISGQDVSVTSRIRKATRVAFEKLVGLAISEQVDFVVIAGDLYDGKWKDYQTGQFFASQMGRLQENGICVYLLYGNHDAESQTTKSLNLGGNVYAFSSKQAETVKLDHLNVALHGQSFSTRDVSDNLAADYPEPISGMFNIAILHTALGGMGGHENYAPCSLDDLRNSGHDYWALGHVHGREILSETPVIVFPGNLQGRHIREQGEKGAYLVEVSDDHTVDMTFLECSDVVWDEIDIDVSGLPSLSGIVEAMSTEILDRSRDVKDNLLVCRIILKGQTEIHNQLLISNEEILAEARAVASGAGFEIICIEKVKIGTSPTASVEELKGRQDALGELLNVLSDAQKDPDFLAGLEKEFEVLLSKLPAEIRISTENEMINGAASKDYSNLIEGVTPFLSANIMTGGTD